MGFTVLQQRFLERTLGNRVTFDGLERKLYGHDVAAIPSLVKPLVGNTTPDAVALPESEDEVIEIVRWANKQEIPVTPRGKGSSGYGGAVPVKQGLVLSFSRMRDIVKVDQDNLTVTVQPGITWERLDTALMAQGLTLRLYPTSYPASTAGGWLAQGGAGIGSYEYGFFSENVVSVRVVLPSGEVRNLHGEELDLVADAEGITGIITEVTLGVQPLEDLAVMALACSTPQRLQTIIEAVVEEDLPIWSMVYINPRMAELKNRAAGMSSHNHGEDPAFLPSAYIISLAYRAKDEEKVKPALEKLAHSHKAEVLSDRIAWHEWENRFKLMVVKRLGPSLVPAEVVVPLANLGDVMAEVEHKVNQPVVKEGVIIREGANGEPEAVILGLIPSDERRFSYNFVFGLVLTVVKIAEKYGGRAYATGLYFSKKAESILGKERVQRLRSHKPEIDPKGIMNPGKVIHSGLLGMALHVAGAFEPLVRPFGNHVITQVGERPEAPVRGIPADVAWYAYSCSQCGYCVDQCPQYYGRGWESQSPRGKWFWLREFMEGRVKWDQRAVDTFMSCTTCETCESRCSVELPVEPAWMTLRGELIQEQGKMTFPPFEMMAAALKAEGDIWAGYRKDRADWFPEDLLEKHGPDHESKAVYFAGCTASYVEHDIAMATARLLDEAGVDFTYLGEKENCCATPMLVAGKWDLFANVMKANIAAVKAAGADTVITSCPACDMMWRKVYGQWAEELGIEYDITTRHYSEILADKINSGDFKFPENDWEPTKVTWHDSCHIGRASGVFDPPRELIEAVPNAELVEMAYNRENSHCCGSVLTLLKEPAVAAEIGEIRLDEAIDAGAEKVLALCPCCEFQLRVSRDTKEKPLEVVDLAHFAASALGYDFPDPDPEVRRQWAVFEAMIDLMTPEGFAKLMGRMWPELIDAMPFGMGPMMRFVGKLGPIGDGIFAVMKPMFPVLFPRLLPMMMPKVMPTMLAHVAESIPMPDYMQEQMPDLMPEVMDNLMPHMIGDVVPMVTEPMIDYLRGRAATP